MNTTHPPTPREPEAGGIHPNCDPTHDRTYRRLVRELFDTRRLDDAFVRAIAQRFRRAPVVLCSKSVGRWVNRKLRDARWTQQQLADRVGVDRSAVAYWVRGGGITLDNLAQVLIELKSQWADLPIPARQELAVAAYLAAVTYTRERLDPAAGRKELDRERFWCLFHLFSEPHWELAVREQNPDLLRREADRVLAAAGQSLGTEVLGVTGVDGLRQVVREWGLAWVVGIGQAPAKWVVK